MRVVPRNWPSGVPVPPPISERYFRDERWIFERMRELQERYANQWIAVVNGEVVASGSVLAEVERLAQERTGADEFPVWLVRPESGYHSHWRVV